MKTILLTSSGQFITKNDLSFLPKPINQMKMAYVTTASKNEEDQSYMIDKQEGFKKLGIDFEELDIKGKTEQELRAKLKDKKVVYVEGGNTFYLLKAVRESGFDKVIKDLVNKGVVYIGSSAGSYICCPTIEVSLWKHPYKSEHFGVADFTAMNLVQFYIFVHYKPKYKELLEEKIPQVKYPVKILTDEQALLIQDEKVELIGDGIEITL